MEIKLTRKEWDEMHGDFKGVREDGRKTMLWLNPKTGGTELAFVDVPDKPVTRYSTKGRRR